ncbi:MAG TPA: HEPN domain-containing protein [Patescibacteria group bacterium]|nr:HEPN domain-containing protein [Patescibacteria group bacterium]
MFNSPRPNSWTYALIIWHCHQTVEKMLKMVALKNGKELLKIHDLLHLAKQAEVNNFPEEHGDFLYDLNKYYFSPRYPDINYSKPYPKSDRTIALKYLNKTEKIFKWLKVYNSPKK